jgi:hypothetical protein
MRGKQRDGSNGHLQSPARGASVFPLIPKLFWHQVLSPWPKPLKNGFGQFQDLLYHIIRK